MRIVTVLNSRSLHGAVQEFKPSHVQALQAQVAKWAPLATFECLTDMEVPGVATLPLTRKYPGWWAKMELFAPEMHGDLLYMDLDTVVVGPLDDLEAATDLTLLRDFYRDGKKLKEGLGSGLMFLPEAARARVWKYWSANPSWNMRIYPRGDQHLFERFYLNDAKRWQDVVPHQIVSYKVHCQNGVPPAARVVCMHGQPRPWAIPQFLHLYR